MTEFLNSYPLLILFFLLAAGLIMSRVIKLVDLPNVTGYLVAGLLIGPCIGGLISKETLSAFSVITNLALGFVAFSIGAEFKLDHIKQIGSKAITITFFQAFGAVFTVMAGITMLHFILGGEKAPTSVILILGAEAAATAPAATLMVVRQYKAKGPVTDALLPVVALDDAIGLMIFSLCLSIAKVFDDPDATLSIVNVLIQPLAEIVASLAFGAAVGTLLSLCMKWFKSRANRLCLMIAAVLIGTVMGDVVSTLTDGWLSMSSLLVCMMIGAMFANMRKDSVQILDGIERWTPPVFMLFFTISGANLDLKLLPACGIVGIVYILFRVVGKYFGTYFGAVVSKADKKIRDYLGIALIPQAGVAIGMALAVAADKGIKPEHSSMVVTVVLCATLIYELVGPVLTKWALTRAGEIEKKK